jgi:DNA polymerase-3 subunit epsilon
MNDDLRFIVFDTETTDVSKDKRAVEIAMMEIDEDLNEIGRCSSLVNPGIPSSPEALAVHHLDEEALKDAPTIEQWVEDTFGGKIDGKVALIGHRIGFDRPLFEPIGDVAHVLDTLVMSWTLVTGAKNRKLDTLKEHLGLEGGGTSHRAMADVMTCHQLLRHLMPLTGRSLRDLCTVPGFILHHMPWGKHEGKLLKDVPRGYRSWLLNEAADIDINLRKSLELVALMDPPRREVIMGLPKVHRKIIIPTRKHK